ncbi:MAG: tetratricopeptide repeat protein [Candidatus Methanoperedens sp.]|nr:tetratricopeptide repeat protein [Candidatus Methanoperedens sp.]
MESPKQKAIPEKMSDKSGGNGTDSANTWGNKGNTLVESSMYAEAIQCFDKALEINPRSAEIWNNKGLALARTGRFADAIKCYDKSLELKPGDGEVIYNKGVTLAQLGQTSEAIACYDKLLEMNPRDADAWCSKGDVLFESNNFEEALRAYDKSIEIDPKDETAWNNRGLTLVKLNRLPEAVESYDKALEINPKVEKIWSNKGLVIARMRENEEKVDLLKIASTMPAEDKVTSSLQPKPVEKVNAIPEKHKMESDPFVGGPEPDENTITDLKSLILDPAPVVNSDPLISKRPDQPSEIFSDKRDPKPMQANENSSSSAPSKNGLEKVVVRVGEDEDKISVIRADQVGQDVQSVNIKTKPLQHESSGPSNVKKSDENLVLGNAMYSKGQYQDAIEYFNKSLQIDPENNTIWNNKGLALAKLGKIDEAIECYDRALRIKSKDYVVLNNKGGALYKKGQVQEALVCYKSAFSLNPESKAAMRGMDICLKSINSGKPSENKSADGTNQK